MVTAVVLAAGRSTRIGRPKVLLPLRGRTILAWVIDAARSSRCDEVLVVLGEEAARVGEEAARAGARTVLNPRYREGMGTSLAAGVGAVGSWCEAVVVLLGDQPGVAASHIDSLIDGYWRTGRPIVASRYGARRGVPALFARALFGEMASLAGDVGGRLLMDRHPEWVHDVPLEGPEPWDVDTPEDYARLTRLLP